MPVVKKKPVKKKGAATAAKRKPATSKGKKAAATKGKTSTALRKKPAPKAKRTTANRKPVRSSGKANSTKSCPTDKKSTKGGTATTKSQAASTRSKREREQEEDEDQEEEEEELEDTASPPTTKQKEEDVGNLNFFLENKVASQNRVNLVNIRNLTIDQIRLGLQILEEDSSSLAPFKPGSVQEKTLDTLSTLILAGARLGHRTSHCLWGAPQCGRRRMLRLLADRLRKKPRSTNGPRFICLSLDADLFRQDELGAVWNLILQVQRDLNLKVRMKPKEKEQWDKFFESLLVSLPNSLLGGTIGAAAKSQFLSSGISGSRLLAPNNSLDSSDDEDDGDEDGERGKKKTNRGHGASGRWDRDLGDDADEDSEEVELIGGAGLLASLQAILIRLTEKGFSIAILIHKIEQFALWNDRLTYVLAGLMHEVEAPGGGISLVMTAGSASVPIEKRLSSRLSCEMWFLPPQPLRLTDLVTSCLNRAFLMLRKPGIFPDAFKEINRVVATTVDDKKLGAKLVKKRVETLYELDDAVPLVSLQEHLDVIQHFSDKLECLNASPSHVQQVAATYFMNQSAFLVDRGGFKESCRSEELTEGDHNPQHFPLSAQVALSLTKSDFHGLVEIQTGEVFDYLLGATRLSVDPFKDPAEGVLVEIPEDAHEEAQRDGGAAIISYRRAADKSTKDTKTQQAAGGEEGAGIRPGEKEMVAQENVDLIQSPEDIAVVEDVARRFFPSWKTNCPHEMFLLIWVVYVNITGKQERTFHETFLALCNMTSERASYRLSYQRALHELVRLRVLKVSRKGILGLQCAEARVDAFLKKVLYDETIAESCGLSQIEVNKLRAAARI